MNAVPPFGQAPQEPSRVPVEQSAAMAGALPSGGKLFIWFFMAMLLFSLYLMYRVLNPFLNSLILACVFAAISHPFYKRCLKLTCGRPVPAALMVILVITFLVVLPISIFVIGSIPQAAKTVVSINQWLSDKQLSDLITTYTEPALLWLHKTFPELDLSSVDIRTSIISAFRSAGQYILGYSTYILANTLLFFAHLLLILLVIFFLLIDGGALLNKLEYLLPLKPRQTAVVIESLRRMSRAVLVGGFCVAALQGIAGGIGFAIVGLPALFWGTVMIFAALVPVVGTGLVWVPAVVVLLLTKEWGSALFLTLWCGIGVTSIDSVLRPLLMRDGAKVPLLLIFLSILGGINVFGMLGLLYGPMILGFVAVMLDIYVEEYHEILESRSYGKTLGEKEDVPEAEG